MHFGPLQIAIIMYYSVAFPSGDLESFVSPKKPTKPTTRCRETTVDLTRGINSSVYQVLPPPTCSS